MAGRKKTRLTSQAVEIAIGQRVRERRLFLDISQGELAGKVGLTFQQIQKYENGKNRIAVSRLLEIAEALKITPVYFLRGLYDPAAPVPGVPSESKDGIQLLRAYAGIESPKLKQQLLTMAKTLAKARVA